MSRVMKMTPESPRGTYSTHWTEDLARVDLDNGVMLLNVGLELERWERAQPVVTPHGMVSVTRSHTPEKYWRDPKERCYDAALALALENPELVYCEGFVFISWGGSVVTMAHGWCVDRVSGCIVDPTFYRHQVDPSVVCYMGISFKTDYVLAQAMETGYVGLLDGRLDGASSGVYFDPPDLWKEEL